MASAENTCVCGHESVDTEDGRTRACGPQ